MVIIKDKATFEALSDEQGPIFFLFIIKCEVIMQHVGGAMRDWYSKHNYT
jgi:uncharacterized protein with ATP-grasp and redox domains